jgi:hypothetical protein
MVSVGGFFHYRGHNTEDGSGSTEHGDQVEMAAIAIGESLDRKVELQNKHNLV